MSIIFAAPIPGQSLTTEPKGLSFERPPEIVDPVEALDLHVENMTNPEAIEDAVKDVVDVSPVDATYREGLESDAEVKEGVRGIMSPVIKEFMGSSDEQAVEEQDLTDDIILRNGDDPTQDLLDRIAFGEGADPKKLKAQDKYGIGSTEYDMVYAYGSALAPDKSVTEMTMKELKAIELPKSEPVIPKDLADAFPTKPVTIKFEGRMIMVSADIARVLIKKGKAELI